MYKLKLIKGLSYSGVVKATKKNPIVEVADEATAQAAVASGYFAMISTPMEPIMQAPGTQVASVNLDVPVVFGTADMGTIQNDQPPAPDFDALSKMNTKALKAYAAEHGIVLDGEKSAPDILKAISAHYGGSATMIDLLAE